jgi:hypothetical protein
MKHKATAFIWSRAIKLYNKMTIHSSTFAFIHSSSSLPLWLVGQKFKSVAYAGLFGGVMVGFGGILYTLYTEMSETSGSYALVERAVKRVESDQRVKKSNYFCQVDLLL